MKEFRVGKFAAGTRTDIFVAQQYPEFTRSAMDVLFDRGLIYVNGNQAKPAHKLRAGDSVGVDEKLLRKEPPNIKLPVLYEDDDVMVIDKPADVLTHSKGALNLEATVASFIKNKLSKGLSGNRAGIVHRLDRGTSGIIIAAKNEKTLKWLQKQFSARKVKKTYLAIVEGRLEPYQAIIDVPIARNPSRPQTFHVNPRGKPAQTEYTVIMTFSKGNHDYSFVELTPLTGRTHQLRVHLKYVKHPIVGDRVYGQPGKHLMLHASALEITLPSGQRKVFEADLPEYIKEFAEL